jgi:hypothetical protein
MRLAAWREMKYRSEKHRKAAYRRENGEIFMAKMASGISVCRRQWLAKMSLAIINGINVNQ